MNTKLIITIEQSVIEKAKEYARKTPTVKYLKGSFKLPKDSDYKKALTDRLCEKYF